MDISWNSQGKSYWSELSGRVLKCTSKRKGFPLQSDDWMPIWAILNGIPNPIPRCGDHLSVMPYQATCSQVMPQQSILPGLKRLTEAHYPVLVIWFQSQWVENQTQRPGHFHQIVCLLHRPFRNVCLRNQIKYKTLALTTNISRGWKRATIVQRWEEENFSLICQVSSARYREGKISGGGHRSVNTKLNIK